MAFLRYALMLIALAALAAAGARAETIAPEPELTSDQILDRIVAREKAFVSELGRYAPMVETYIQQVEDSAQFGSIPTRDRYSISKLDLKNGVTTRKLLDDGRGFGGKGLGIRFAPEGFAQMALIDSANFDRNHYGFEFVRREFLGEVRCLVFDVQPNAKSKSPGFLGRIWVEDRDYSIVRFNGTYTQSSRSKIYFHFESWREQMGPGLWLPTYVYTEESGEGALRFKGQTRFWAYSAGRSSGQNEFTSLAIEADKVKDFGDQMEQMSPVLGQRAWVRQAEDNVIQRMEKAGLVAPEGDADSVLQTVITNLEITNNLSITPETRSRILLTSPLESFAVGNTVILSRGLIDVLPDEASLAMVLAHELAHIVLGHHIDTKYAFSDRMLFEDVDSYRRLFVRRDPAEEKAADEKALELLANSPYKDKLGNAGLFLKALHERSGQLTELLRSPLGNSFVDGKNIQRMPGLMKNAPKLESGKVDQIAALPLGGRLRVDPWTNRVDLIKSKPVSLLSAREKMPFEVTPVFLYLTRQKDGLATASAATAP